MIQRILLAATFIALAVPALAQQPAEFQEGLHYQQIPNAPAAPSGPVVVTELFSYYCPHCATFEPYLETWKARKPADVEFERIPVVFGRKSWEVAAKGYVAADMMGIAEASHEAMMNAIHRERRVFRSLDELAVFYADYGVEPGEYLSTANSFATFTRMQKEQQKSQRWGVTGTPAIVVDGRWRVQATRDLGGYEGMLRVVDHLVERARALRDDTAVAAEAASTDATG